MNMEVTQEIKADKNINNVCPATKYKAIIQKSDSWEENLPNDTKDQDDDTDMMNPLLEYIDSSIIGRETVFSGPYGPRRGRTQLFFGFVLINNEINLAWLTLLDISNNFEPQVTVHKMFLLSFTDKI